MAVAAVQAIFGTYDCAASAPGPSLLCGLEFAHLDHVLSHSREAQLALVIASPGKQEARGGKGR